MQKTFFSIAAMLLAALLATVGCTPSQTKQTTSQPPAQPVDEPVAATPAPAPAEAPAEPEPQTAEPPPAPPPAEGKRVAYAPHVTIDWSVPQVEIDARIVLREGLLELLMCSAGTKEHESILATQARPKQIYEALGLIGLAAGRPAQYDPQTSEVTPASGAPLALEIACPDGDAEKVVAAHEWLASPETLQPVAPPSWIFCGSREDEGRFLADVDGTVACVVDFDTSLIGLAERHSASDAELWAAANTPRVPPVGTSCRLIVRALATDPIVVQLTPENYFATHDAVIDALQLDALIKQRIRHYPAQRVELSAAPGTPNNFARVAGRCIIGSGIAPENLSLTLHPEGEDPAAPGQNASPAPTDAGTNGPPA